MIYYEKSLEILNFLIKYNFVGKFKIMIGNNKINIFYLLESLIYSFFFIHWYVFFNNKAQFFLYWNQIKEKIFSNILFVHISILLFIITISNMIKLINNCSFQGRVNINKGDVINQMKRLE